MFKTFPEFSKLTLADKDEYEALIKDYPPIADISFPMLMTWWSASSEASIATLNDNMVISYWLPGDEAHSGLSLIGKSKIDESVCSIFDYLRDRGDEPRLVHVPDFVMANMRYPELFNFTSEPDYDEYVLSIAKHYPLENIPSHRQARVKKIVDSIGSQNVVVKSLDLDDEASKYLLIEAAHRWRCKPSMNDTVNLSFEVIPTAVVHAHELGFENVCLFIDDVLQGFLLYIQPSDEQYAIAEFIKVNPRKPYFFDYLVYKFAQWFSENGVRYVNMDSDLGVPLMRRARLQFEPVNFYRKYSIEPA